MSNETARPVRGRNRGRLGAAVVGLALAALVASAGCSLGTSAGSASPTVCADKVVQSIAQNAKVAGLYNCLSPDFQGKLKNYVAAGLAHSNDDAVFTDGTSNKPPVIGTHLVGLANGVAVYAVIVQNPTAGAVTITFTIWLNPAPKVNNLAISQPLF